MDDYDNRLKLPISLSLNDGREFLGDLIVSVGGTVERTLNSEAKFILFGDLDGTERMIAKSVIVEVSARKTAKIVKLPTEAKVDDSDPYELLGIEKTATDSEIKEAWHARARAYHADKFANVEMPPEVAAYTNAMSRRINEAYAVLTAGKTQKLKTGTGPMAV
ncbi:MAG: J domain-containing protein [Rhizobiaceae bacterium]